MQIHLLFEQQPRGVPKVNLFFGRSLPLFIEHACVCIGVHVAERYDVVSTPSELDRWHHMTTSDQGAFGSMAVRLIINHLLLCANYIISQVLGSGPYSGTSHTRF